MSSIESSVPVVLGERARQQSDGRNIGRFTGGYLRDELTRLDMLG